MDQARVRVALFGQPGAGKSSLINRLIGRPMAAPGVHTDTTTEAARYDWDGVDLHDLPGYDTRRFPRETYFQHFDIASFDLFVCIFDSKLHAADRELFLALKAAGKTTILVRNKRDTLWQGGAALEELISRTREDVASHVGGSESCEIIFTSCRDGAGIEELSDAIRDSLGAVRKERWALSAKARSTKFLEERRVTCRDRVTVAAGLAIANGLNPVPGIDVAVDIGILLKLFTDVRTTYGLDDAEVANMSRVPPALAAGLKDITLLATRGGLARLIEKCASRAHGRAFLKWTPFIGQIVAASTGFAMMSSAGNAFVQRCHGLASAILETELANY
jgi:hypothetical protein